MASPSYCITLCLRRRCRLHYAQYCPTTSPSAARRTESWSNFGACLHAMIDGIPATVVGTMCFEPHSAGCLLDTQLTAEVDFPLFSGQVEQTITTKVAALMDTEYQFTLEWLCKSTV
jgi:hypothetical protein